MTETRTVQFMIPGEPASKANQRQLVTFGGAWVKPHWHDVVAPIPELAALISKAKKIGGTPRLIKSKKAQAYAESVREHAPQIDPLLEGELHLFVFTWYATQRPDLECEVLRDALEGIVYKNDRQLRSVAMEHGIDRENPRSLVIVSPRRK